MKSSLFVHLVAAALVAGPTMAAADFCSPDKRYKKHGYYGHPHARNHHPMQGRMHHRGYPGPYWQHGRAYGPPGAAAGSGEPAVG